MYSPSRFTSLLTLTATVCLLAASCLADSQVRIVRLSSVQGDVQIDRATGEGFETAFDNLPITQGAKIKTRTDGRAEVEFEDGSTVRIAPLSVVEFPALSLRDSGAKVSTIDVKHGTAYVNFAGKKDDEFTLNFEKEHIAVTDASRFRVFVAADGSMVSVFNGNLNVDAPTGQVAVEKKHSASFLPDQDQPKIAKSVPELEFDDWDKSQQQYHDRYMAKSNDVSPYAYGMSDMNYYGSFSNIPGYGMAWQPYFAGAGWDPYMNGSWASYPGVGYTWVSAYPWGWTPYHYGSWSNVPGYGWAWLPGGSWAGYGRTPMTAGFTRPGLQAPAGAGRTLVVNRGPVSSVRSNKIVINSGSAGMGVARGSLRNPAQISQQVNERGSVKTGVRNTPITAPPPSYTSSAQSGVYSGQTAASGRTMSAPSSAGRSGGGMGGGSRPSSAGSTRR
jgi:FecR protein